MFQPVVVVLMLCSITVHTVLGCCWHHGHPEHGSSFARPAATHAHIHFGDADGDHHSRHQTAESGRPPFECPEKSCCGEPTCTYVTSPPAKLPVPELQQLGGIPALLGTMCSPPGSLALADRRFLEKAPPLSGTSSVRGLTQVWLL